MFSIVGHLSEPDERLTRADKVKINDGKIIDPSAASTCHVTLAVLLCWILVMRKSLFVIGFLSIFSCLRVIYIIIVRVVIKWSDVW